MMVHLVLCALLPAALRIRSPLAQARDRPRAGVLTMTKSTGLAILFDCDGVLADTERDGHRVSFNKVFAEQNFGFQWGVEEYGRLCEVGGGKERMTAYFNANDCWPANFKNPTTSDLVTPKGLPIDPKRLDLVKACHARKTELFQELIASGVVPLRSGVLRLVDEAIAHDVPLSVCSTSNEAAVRTLVRTLMGETRYGHFAFFCGDVVQRKKARADRLRSPSKKAHLTQRISKQVPVGAFPRNSPLSVCVHLCPLERAARARCVQFGRRNYGYRSI